MAWKLKNCECGCRSLKLVEDRDANYTVKCTDCGKTGVWADDVEEAIRFWNEGSYIEDDGVEVFANDDREPVNKKAVSYD